MPADPVTTLLSYMGRSLQWHWDHGREADQINSYWSLNADSTRSYFWQWCKNLQEKRGAMLVWAKRVLTGVWTNTTLPALNSAAAGLRAIATVATDLIPNLSTAVRDLADVGMRNVAAAAGLTANLLAWLVVRVRELPASISTAIDRAYEAIVDAETRARAAAYTVKDKVNELAAWTNYMMRDEGVFREEVLGASTSAWPGAVLAGVMNKMLRPDGTAIKAQLATQYPVDSAAAVAARFAAGGYSGRPEVAAAVAKLANPSGG